MRRWMLATTLFALVVPAAPALATVIPMSGPLPDDLRGLVEAEQRFCARAKETSIRDAFFEALDVNGIVFRPGPINGKDFFRDRPSNPGPLLHWTPSYAEISSFGDLGWTTGPWEYTATGDKKPSAFGHFATMWQFGVDRRWHVLIDFGHSQPQPAAPESLTFARLGGDKAAPRMMSLAEFTTTNVTLARADSAYSQALAHQGMPVALAQFADPDVRVYRDGRPPYHGVEEAGKALAHEWDHGAVAWGVNPGAIAKSGDLAFTYGVVDLPAGKKDEPTRRNIFRVWRKAPGETWRLALDVTIPAPLDPATQRPAPPPTPEPKQP